MEKKTKILAAALLIVAIGVVAIWGITNRLYPFINCGQLYQEIEDDFANANFCSQDSDCKTVEVGGAYIEFGCYKYVNKQTNEHEIFQKMDLYYENCTAPIDECMPPLKPVCASGKCVSPCEKEKQFAESVSSSPKCKGQSFKCIGGGESIAYYDSRLTSTVQTGIGGFIPEEVENAAVAFFYTSSCSCINPISYEKINTETRAREETSCNGFYQLVQDYNASCNGCLLSWVTFYE